MPCVAVLDRHCFWFCVVFEFYQAESIFFLTVLVFSVTGRSLDNSASPKGLGCYRGLQVSQPGKTPGFSLVAALGSIPRGGF